ncbi:MAG: class I SAM-dependent methyltransferase [Phycisphaerae bacterium]|nr:class I SAM-dependent methyltransferase [Saprospiraceae bacterium]
MENIETYYNALAPDYDQSRFGNSYGQFIHTQERKAFARILDKSQPKSVLDLACGTGRMLDFAQTGCDLSPQMLAEAQKKHPSKTLVLADATYLPFADGAFDLIFSMHFFMHLDGGKIAAVLAEANRVLCSGGRFVFDFPSEKRRRLTGGHHGQNWHGSNAFSLAGLSKLASEGDWRILKFEGILFIPIHRVPTFLRPHLLRFDTFLCRSFLKEYASYCFVCLQKK